jgi:hypothetical protein
VNEFGFETLFALVEGGHGLDIRIDAAGTIVEGAKRP